MSVIGDYDLKIFSSQNLEIVDSKVEIYCLKERIQFIFCK